VVKVLSNQQDVDREEVRGTLIRRINSLQWHSDAVDLYDYYLHLFQERIGCTTMPPSPGVAAYVVKGVIDTDEGRLSGQFKLRWEEGYLNLIKNHIMKDQPEQLYHRSRIAAIGSSFLRANELARRVASAAKYREEIQKLAFDDDMSGRVLDLVLGRTLKSHAIDSNWIARYINEHSTSSTGEGLKWDKLRVLNVNDWADIGSHVYDLISNLMGSNRSKYLHTPLYTGSRARSPELTSISDTYNLDIDRTRIIMFHPGLSIWTVFQPDKVKWYRDIMQGVMKLLDINPSKIHLPIIEGGRVYITMNELLKKGKHYWAYDGKSWESAVGTIMGPAWRSIMTNINSEMLGSGITLTTACGTISSLKAYKKYFDGYEAIILGDDMNIFTDDAAKPFPGTGVVEYQPLDTQLKFMLGTSYFRDMNQPRLQGIKLTVDRGDKVLPLAIDEEQSEWLGPYVAHHDIKTKMLWYGMHYGWFGNKTLIDAISSIKAEDFKSPGDMIRNMVYTTEFDFEQSIEWAESVGVNKKVLIGG
jgi:hypothetical protein